MKWTQISSLVSKLEEEPTTDGSEYEVEVHSYRAPQESPSRYDRDFGEGSRGERSLPNHRSSLSSGCTREDSPNSYASRTVYSTNRRPTNYDNRFATRCSHCQILGHTTRTCRWLLRQCLACGNDENSLGECPHRYYSTPPYRRRQPASVNQRDGRLRNQSRAPEQPRVTASEQPRHV